MKKLRFKKRNSRLQDITSLQSSLLIFSDVIFFFSYKNIYICQLKKLNQIIKKSRRRKKLRL